MRGKPWRSEIAIHQCAGRFRSRTSVTGYQEPKPIRSDNFESVRCEDALVRDRSGIEAQRDAVTTGKDFACDTVCMKSKGSSPHPSSNLPVSKQTAGGVAGAIVGGVIAGPVGAVAGAIAGTIMGNRAAKGKTLISSGTVRTASNAVKVVKDKLPSSTMSKVGKSASKTGAVSSSRPKSSASPKSARKATPRATAKKRTAKSK